MCVVVAVRGCSMVEEFREDIRKRRKKKLCERYKKKWKDKFMYVCS